MGCQPLIGIVWDTSYSALELGVHRKLEFSLPDEGNHQFCGELSLGAAPLVVQMGSDPGPN